MSNFQLNVLINKINNCHTHNDIFCPANAGISFLGAPLPLPPPRPPPLPPRSPPLPPPPKPPSFLAPEKSTLIGLPSKFYPVFSIALSTALVSANSTWQNPFGSPVSLSVAILTPLTSPQSPKKSAILYSELEYDNPPTNIVVEFGSLSLLGLSNAAFFGLSTFPLAFSIKS